MIDKKNLIGKVRNMSINNNPCSCCGYKTLETNDIGEICNVCFWEEDYSGDNEWFTKSVVNKISLYRAQQNFIKFGACNKRSIKFIRNPLEVEGKQSDWQTIQCKINRAYDDEQLTNIIQQCASSLVDEKAEVGYKNFGTIKTDYYRSLDELEEYFDDDIYQAIGKLESAAKSLADRNVNNVIDLLKGYYVAGMSNCTTWYILLYMILDAKSCKVSNELNEILIDMDINNYYGDDRLHKNINNYWAAAQIQPGK